MANVANLVYNSPYLNSLGVTIPLPNSGGRVRNLLMNPFYVTPAFLFRFSNRPTTGQIWPRGIGLVQITNMGVPTGAQVYPSSDASLTDNTLTAVIFNTELVDDESFWAVGSPTKIVVPESAWYVVTGQITVDGAAGSGSGVMSISLRVNGVTTRAEHDKAFSPATFTIGVTALLKLEASDYVELMAFAQLNGPALTLKGGQNATFLQAVKLL